MDVVLRAYKACGCLAVGAENSICAKIVTFCVRLVGGTKNFICAKIVMHIFEVCCCGVGMLSTEGPSSFMICWFEKSGQFITCKAEYLLGYF